MELIMSQNVRIDIRHSFELLDIILSTVNHCLIAAYLRFTWVKESVISLMISKKTSVGVWTC